VRAAQGKEGAQRLSGHLIALSRQHLRRLDGARWIYLFCFKALLQDREGAGIFDPGEGESGLPAVHPVIKLRGEIGSGRLIPRGKAGECKLKLKPPRALKSFSQRAYRLVSPGGPERLRREPPHLGVGVVKRRQERGEIRVASGLCKGLY